MKQTILVIGLIVFLLSPESSEALTESMKRTSSNEPTTIYSYTEAPEPIREQGPLEPEPPPPPPRKNIPKLQPMPKKCKDNEVYKDGKCVKEIMPDQRHPSQ